ncbi:hypothetical protein SLA_7179 [Streptomyces laurentii]|uniref:Uncharacterized protein n=1 Tax=Streptomyces laurentii TaxID=39478 RepID=A0A160P9L6_STRLU|nr:hypothetical protein SLA_7179 [Streptomyces laurentii]
MTEPSDGTTHGSRLRLREVADLDDQTFTLYIEERFDQLVTAAIADADGFLSPDQHHLLHEPQRLEFLRDALTYAEGGLQVSVERMAYHRDARTARTGRLLRRVRTALHETDRTLATERRADARRRAADGGPQTDVVLVARGWLASALPDHFERLLAQTLTEAGLPDRPAAADVFDAVENGWSDGYLNAPRTPEVDHLLAKGPIAFQGAVAADARDQADRITELRHPLLQRRWASGLAELTDLTVPVARASSTSALGRLPDDVYDLPEADAKAVFAARRFLVAIWQRRAEHTHLLHNYAATVTDLGRSSPREALRRRAVDQAIDRLATEQPDAAARMLTGLQQHTASDGLAGLTPTERTGLKHRLVAEARAAARTPRSLTTALPPGPAPLTRTAAMAR